MNTEEFKIKYPNLSHLEGNDLWDAMENAWIYEHKDDKIEDMMDWKGNVIKEGDEICFIKIRTGGFFKNFGIMTPNGDGTFTSHSVPDAPDEDCWQIGDYIKIEKGLMYTTKSGEYTFHQPISMLKFQSDAKHILAIKGISNTKPND